MTNPETDVGSTGRPGPRGRGATGRRAGACGSPPRAR